MGDRYNLTVQGVGWAEVELLTPCEAPVVFTGRITGAAPKNIGEPLRLDTISAKIGAGEHSEFRDPLTGHEYDFWSKTVHLTMSGGAGIAWYELDGTHDRLEAVEEPEGSDTYVLVKDGQTVGRVTVLGPVIEGPA